MKQSRVSMKVRKLLVTLALCLMGGLTEAAYAESPKFAWPVPSRVTVTEITHKKGKSAKTSYDIVLRKQASGDDLDLKFENFQFLELNGVDLTSPEAKQQLGPKLAQMNGMGSLIPTLVISPEGSLKDVTGIEEMIEGSLKFFPGTSDPKVRAEMSATLHKPAVIEMVKSKSAEFWKVWVETWLACDTTQGTAQTVDIEVPISGGSIVKAPMKLANDGADAGTSGNLKFSALAVLEGETAKKALKETMTSIIAQAPPKPGEKPFTLDSIKAFKRTEKFSVVTNPKTLQPSHATWETNTDLTLGAQQSVQTEKHDYSFKWAAPTK